MSSDAKSPIKIYGNDALSSRVAAFQKKADEHKVKKKSNPFSQIGNVSGRSQIGNVSGFSQIENVSGLDRPKWDKSDPRYGTPVEGSKTAMRGMAAGSHISNEVIFLCDMINEYGIPGESGTVWISFGELFQIYTSISNKVVGILLRARKHGLVHFEGEMLFQRRDDDVIITLLKPISEIRPQPRGAVKRKHDEEEPMDFAISPEDY